MEVLADRWVEMCIGQQHSDSTGGMKDEDEGGHVFIDGQGKGCKLLRGSRGKRILTKIMSQ